MTTEIKPAVFHLATTMLKVKGAQEYLRHIGAGDWTWDKNTEDHAVLTEICGRGCYRSFGVGLNKNVTRVREGNKDYIGNGILKPKHGSVLEHSTDTFAICDVSRVVTHELVRHRAGLAVSQESGRFVRVDEIRYYLPDALRDEVFLREVHAEVAPDDDFWEWQQAIVDAYMDGMQQSEDQIDLMENTLLQMDKIKNFDKKKKLQSAVRRIAPFGMASNIVLTANHRAWRHIVSARTAGGAEEEVRLVQWQIFERLVELHPNIYQDARISYESGVLPFHVPIVSFENEKV